MRGKARVRALALLGVGVIVGTLIMTVPATAHVGGTISHLWKHIKPKADARYQTGVWGATSTADINDFTSASFTPILSTTINAPRSGFLMIVGSVGAEDDVTLVGKSQLSLRLSVDATAVTADNFAFRIYGDEASTKGSTAGLNAVVPISKGSHTVNIDGRELGTGTYITGRSLSIAFFAKGSGVSIPVPARPNAAARNTD